MPRRDVCTDETSDTSLATDRRVLRGFVDEAPTAARPAVPGRRSTGERPILSAQQREVAGDGWRRGASNQRSRLTAPSGEDWRQPRRSDHRERGSVPGRPDCFLRRDGSRAHCGVQRAAIWQPVADGGGRRWGAVTTGGFVAYRRAHHRAHRVPGRPHCIGSSEQEDSQ